jgi:hypothetical protein
MLGVTSTVFALCVLSAGTPAAQQQTSPPVESPAIQKPKPAPAAAGETPTADIPLMRTGAQAVNLRMEVTITDQRGQAPASPKTVTAVIADKALGRIRTSGVARVGTSFEPIALNVDLQPEILKDGKIRTQVTLEYRAQTAEGPSEVNQPSSLTETFTVILEDGKPLMVTQSADPATDRKVKVELKATLAR